MIGCVNNILNRLNERLYYLFTIYQPQDIECLELTKEEIEEYQKYISFPFGDMYHTFIHRKMVDGVEVVNVYRIKIEEEDNYE